MNPVETERLLATSFPLTLVPIYGTIEKSGTCTYIQQYPAEATSPFHLPLDATPLSNLDEQSVGLNILQISRKNIRFIHLFDDPSLARTHTRTLSLLSTSLFRRDLVI